MFIPIWLFVIFVTNSAILTLIVGIYIISYAKMKHYENQKNKELAKKYSKKE